MWTFLAGAAVCPVPANQADMPAEGTPPGRAEPHPVVNHTAAERNLEGADLYKNKDFRGAETKYRAALDSQPDYRAARLNLACALARQERFANAAHEAARLIEEEFLPWSREVQEATDLAVLHTRPELRLIEDVRKEARASWAREARSGLVVVAGVAPPVVPRGTGNFVLALRQELFSWRPDTGRFLQLTAEDGRVLAQARSRDGRRVIYLRSGKLVRAKDGAADEAAPAHMQDLAVRVLDLDTLIPGPVVEIPGAVTEMDMGFVGQGQGAAAWISLPAGNRKRYFRIVDDRLVAMRGIRALGTHVQLGVPRDRTRHHGPAHCRFTAADVATEQGPRVQIRPRRGPPFNLPSRHGMALFALTPEL